MSYIRIAVGRGKNPMSVAIQNILLAHGFSWVGDGIKPYVDVAGDVICVNLNERKLSVLNLEGPLFDPATEMTEILHRLTTDITRTVKLNDTLTAKVSQDKIVVGCQTFSAETLNTLFQTWLAVKSELPKEYVLLGHGGSFKLPPNGSTVGLNGMILPYRVRDPKWMESSVLSWDDPDFLYAAKADSSIVKLNSQK